MSEENDVWGKLLKSKIWHYPPSKYLKNYLKEKGMSEKKQYLHLYLQQLIKLLPVNKNFKEFIQTLQLIKNDITELELELLDDENFTSRSFYVTLLIRNLPLLKSLTICTPNFFGQQSFDYSGSYSGQMRERTLIALCKG